METDDILLGCTGFDWDEHNAEKKWEKHSVTPFEFEQIFFNLPLVLADDIKHSQNERRFYALGKTDAGRMLFGVFTIRQNNIRVIMARDMNREERAVYQSHE